MVVEARLRIRHRGCFTERLVGATQGAQLAAERDADVVALQAADPTALDGVLRAVSTDRSRVDIVSRTPTSAVVRLRGNAHSISTTIARAGCTPLWPALFVGGEELYTVLAQTREALDDLVLALRVHGHVSIDHVADALPSQLAVNVPMTDITTNLTERQLIVLQKAIADGYYDSPRRTSTEALAASFGVTRSTLEEHLRKAERRVLEGFASVLLAQPVLARAAARRPGRPPAKLAVR